MLRGNSHTERIELNQIPFALVCAINSFNGVLCGKINSTHKRWLLSCIIGQLKVLAENFQQAEFNLCSIYGPISSRLLESVSAYVVSRRQASNVPPSRLVARGECQNNQSGSTAPDYASLSARAESVLRSRTQWRIQPLPRCMLHQTVCPLCAQVIRTGKKNGVYSGSFVAKTELTHSRRQRQLVHTKQAKPLLSATLEPSIDGL